MRRRASLKTIIVGTDGSSTAAQAVREAGNIAQSSGARVHVVSAYERITSATEAIVDEAAATLREMGAEAEGHVLAGDPTGAILEVADEEHADLIVVGGEGMESAERFFADT